MTTLQEQYTEEQVHYIENVRQGRFNLSWLTDDEPTWGVRAVPKDPQRGLTLQDINAAYAGEPYGRANAGKSRLEGSGAARVEPLQSGCKCSAAYTSSGHTWR